MEDMIQSPQHQNIFHPVIIILGCRQHISQVFLAVEGHTLTINMAVISAVGRLLKVHCTRFHDDILLIFQFWSGRWHILLIFQKFRSSRRSIRFREHILMVSRSSRWQILHPSGPVASGFTPFWIRSMLCSASTYCTSCRAVSLRWQTTCLCPTVQIFWCTSVIKKTTKLISSSSWYDTQYFVLCVWILFVWSPHWYVMFNFML